MSTLNSDYWASCFFLKNTFIYNLVWRHFWLLVLPLNVLLYIPSSFKGWTLGNPGSGARIDSKGLLFCDQFCILTIQEKSPVSWRWSFTHGWDVGTFFVELEILLKLLSREWVLKDIHECKSHMIKIKENAY